MSIKKIAGAVALTALLTTGVASAQTTTPTSTAPTSTVPRTTPGVPSTGSGGDMAANIIVLATAGAVALAGGVYLSRRLVRE